MVSADGTGGEQDNDDMRPDWSQSCELCGMKPVVPVTGMCGPCSFGEAATMHGAWWDEKTDQPK